MGWAEHLADEVLAIGTDVGRLERAMIEMVSSRWWWWGDANVYDSKEIMKEQFCRGCKWREEGLY